MKRTAVVRDVTLGAVITGLVVPVAAAAASAGGDSLTSLCRSTLGEHGPAGGPVVGEGPSGDPMSVTIGWEATDWMDGLKQIVTCVSVDGRLDPGLTTAAAAPFNTGTLAVNLTLPAGEPGTLVCEQSILDGSGRAEGRHKPTSPVCFKLRMAGALAGGAPVAKGPVGPPAPVSAPAPRAKAPMSSPAPDRKPAPAPAPAPKAPEAPAGAAAPTPYPASTPPARAAFEATRARVATPAATRPVLPSAATPQSAPTANETARAGAAISSPRTDPLPRTGLENKIPMAAAGSLLALGGAALILGEPRRRVRPARAAF